jgi:hypothetical protein
MPHEEGYWFIVWWIKTNETWATDWGPICKQTLIQTYNGATFPRHSEPHILGGGEIYGNSYTLVVTGWTESYYHWNLTSARLKYEAVVYVPVPATTSNILVSFIWNHFSLTQRSYVSVYEP